MKTIQVHRFHNKVAIYVGDGETCYLTLREARQLAEMLHSGADSVQNEDFVNSSFVTQEMHVKGTLS